MKLLLIKNFFKDKKILLPIIFGIIIILSNFIYVGWKVGLETSMLSLHYNIYFGIDQLGEAYRIYFYPIFSLLIFLINLSISFAIYNKQKIISFYLLCLAVLSNIFLLLGSGLIIIINEL